MHVSHAEVDPSVHKEPSIRLETLLSAHARVGDTIRHMRMASPGNVFFIPDSDHTRKQVLAELDLLWSVVQVGDYGVVEDGNINGNWVLPGWGERPL